MDSPNSPKTTPTWHDSDSECDTVDLLKDYSSQKDLENVCQLSTKTEQRSWINSLFLPLHLCAFILYTGIFAAMVLRLHFSISRNIQLGDLSTSQEVESHKEILFSPIRDAVHHEVHTLHNSVHGSNRFKGPPTQSVNDAWESLFEHTNIRISARDLARLNRTSVPLSDGSGDYLATPDTYHQLHCLWYIFKYIHPESYDVKPTNVPVIDHVDHCIDSLRQHLMCHATTSVQTYSWIPNLRIPWANFNVDNVCVDWEAYNGWVKDHSINEYDPHMLSHPDLGPSFPNGPQKSAFKGDKVE